MGGTMLMLDLSRLMQGSQALALFGLPWRGLCRCAPAFEIFLHWTTV